MISTIGSGVLATVADAAVRALLVAAVIGLALTAFRVTRATARLWAWTVVLLVAISMPVMSRVLPNLRWTLPAVAPFDRLLSVEGSSSLSLPAHGSSSAATVTPSQPGRSTVLSWAASAVTWQRSALAIYFFGAAVLLFRAFRSWRITRVLARYATRVHDQDAHDRMTRLAMVTGLSRLPVLAESSALRVPVTMSVMTPTIVLPATWRAWSVSRLDAVLAHELSHVAQRDTLTQRLSLIYRAVVWFSPLSWWLHHRLAELAEQSSDEAALSAGSDRAEYAETLLAFFSEIQLAPRHAGWHVAMARGAAQQAERRVDRILAWKGDPSMKLTRRVLLGVALAAVPVAVVAASVRPWLEPSVPVLEPQIVVTATPPPVVAPAPKAPSSAPVAISRTANRTRAIAPAVVAPAVTPAVAPTVAQTQKPDDDFAAGAYRPGPGLVNPTVIRGVEPKYTSDAMRAKLQGVVTLEIVILPDGTVGKARIAKTPDGATQSPTYLVAGYEAEAEQLNNQALLAAQSWLFHPGMLNGQPVAVVVMMDMNFRLHY